MVTPFLFPWLLPKFGSVFSFFTAPPGEVKLRSVPPLPGSTAQRLEGPWESEGEALRGSWVWNWRFLLLVWPNLGMEVKHKERVCSGLRVSPQLLRAGASLKGTMVILSLWKEV